MTRLSTPSSTRSRLDRVGIALSGLCAAHCVAGLLLVGVVGLGSHWLLAPAIHEIGLVLALVVGGATIGFGAMRYGRRLPLVIGLAGIVMMAVAVAGPHGLAEAALTIAGVAFVALGHALNLREAMRRA